MIATLNLQTRTAVFTIALILCISPARLAALEIGEAGPSFTLPALNSASTITLSDFRGKVVYVDFWASWCGPCRKSLPMYEQMQTRFDAQDFQIIAINLDEHIEDANGFLEQHPVTYSVAVNPDGDIAERWGIRVMPTSFLLDRQGEIRFINQGFKPSHIAELEHEIQTLIDQD